MDFNYVTPLPQFIGTLSRYGALYLTRGLNASLTVGSAAWPAANQATYTPFWVPWHYPVNRLWWINGSAAGGNVAVGVYSVNGTRIYASGSTAGSGNSVPQYVTPSTPFILSPGAYYMALVMDNTTANRLTAVTSGSNIGLRRSGLVQQASAFTLPATMAPATTTHTSGPICGVTRTASGF